MRAASCMGLSATTIWIVEQFGLAIIPWFLNCAIFLAFTSGTTRGTSGSIRKWDVLSTTTAPAATAIGANLALTCPPAENNPMSTPWKEFSFRISTRSCLFWKGRNCPAERSEAKRRNSSTGNWRSSNTSRNCSPTAPVAPTIATLYLSFFTSDYSLALSILSRTSSPICLQPTSLQPASWMSPVR